MSAKPVRTQIFAKTRPFDGLRHAIRTILTVGLLFAVFGAVLTETIAIVWTRALPSWPVHLIALAAALICGYAAAMTIALRETIHGIVSSLEIITKELERLASRTLHDAETLIHRAEDEVSPRPPMVTPDQLRLPGALSSRVVDGMLSGFEEAHPERQGVTPTRVSEGLPAGV